MNKIIKFLTGLPWKEAAKAAIQILLPAALGGTIGATLAGCSSMTPTAKTQGISLYAIGVPGIAVVTTTTQNADNKGDDENKPKQTNPVTTNLKVK